MKRNRIAKPITAPRTPLFFLLLSVLPTMMIDANDCWLLPDGIDVCDLTEHFKAGLRAVATADPRKRIVLCDTFAWQLWRQGMVLCRLDETLALCCLKRPSIDEAIAVCEAPGNMPRFWWDWPDGPMRDMLRPLIDLRAMMPVAEVNVVTHRIDLRNGDDKTVARIVAQRYERPAECQEQAIGICHVVPIRGYDRESQAARRVFQERGFPPVGTSPIEMILQQAGRRPSVWTSKPECRISPETTLREAIRRLATQSLAICQSCEAGIIDDIDTEFLHDYRVSLRRLRSTLKLVKHVFPAEVTANVLSGLAHSARRTNRLRDLDVYLLNRSHYLARTPPDLRTALGEMFEDLQAERVVEQRRVATHLGSGPYRAEMERLASVFDEDRWWPVTANSHATAISLANQVLPKRYGKIRRMQTAITEVSSDQRVHDVRLETKKLRYLLEFFGGLYPPPLVASLSKRLKKLQNTLGDFNDLTVQQASLRAYIEGKASAAEGCTELILAVGSLLGILHRQHRELRQQAFRRLEAFAADETQSLVRNLSNNWSRAA